MLSHEKIHTGDRQVFPCKKCSVPFVTWKSLDKHEPKCAGISFDCSFCEQKFTTRGKMLTHELTHTGEKKFKCKLCEYEVDNVGSLQKHEVIHTNEHFVKCEVCNISISKENRTSTAHFLPTSAITSRGLGGKASLIVSI